MSTAQYQHTLNRLSLMTKSALIGLIHDKAMRSPSMAYDDGEATTLMGTDVDGLEGVAGMFHETWAQCLEVAFGIALLAREVGWIWPLPLVLIYRACISSLFFFGACSTSQLLNMVQYAPT